MPAKREVLEVPAVTPLERRLQVTSPTAGGRPQIGPVAKSSVLDRVRGFIPSIQAANAQLQQQLQSTAAEELNIENVDEQGTGDVIEMDLACGVLDLKDEAALAAAQQAMAAGGGDPLGLQGLVDAAEDDDTSDSSSSDDSSQGSHESMGVDDDEGNQEGESGVQEQGGVNGQSPRDGSSSGGRRRLRAKRHAGITEMDAGG